MSMLLILLLSFSIRYQSRVYWLDHKIDILLQVDHVPYYPEECQN